ncbi:MAG: enoyl-CoA hydratase/isomerase family protein [Actinobacteria bacterium]|uniref:3-hydroxyisobutyryl-CoA hydrolase n=1 Tax=freshwater metagenome TaxID=449393 RepID=A0A6J6QD17_9ZZZZ|nr:enoyl-CoA hydratase/isomerase family protein [Actinomycetota bacterium]
MSATAQEGPDSPVLVHVDGHAGHLVLNRPRAINALTHEMVAILQRTLDAWRDDDAIRTVVLTGAGERGLCAGGDIVSIHADAVSDGPAEDSASAAFWHDEYVLNATIAAYPKPYVAIMDGIVLGGGVGVSAHARHRVVTERSSIGMPETGIGFVPDVGGTWLLGHAPGELGTHLALTAGAVRAGDAIEIGLADVYVPTESLPDLLAALAEGEAGDVLARAAQPVPVAPLAADRDWIDRCYAGDDVATILARLHAAPEEAAQRAGALVASRSPTALSVTLRALRSARALPDLGAALAQEYRIVVRFLDTPDFAEGVRAAVIDKDRNPAWRPADLADIQPASIDEFFAPLTHELRLAPATGGTA